MDAMGSAIGESEDRVLHHVTLDGKAPELGLSGVDVGIRHAQLGWRQVTGRTRQSKWPEVVIRNQGGAGGNRWCADRTEDRAPRRVKAGVKGNVAEVAFIADAEAASNA